MTIFEWIVILAVIVPLGVFLWLCLVLIVVNLPNYMRTLLATAKLSKMKNDSK